MLEKAKANWQWIVVIAAVLLLLLNIKQCNDGKAATAKAEKFDEAIASINDKLVKVVDAQGDTAFQKRAAEYNLKELVNSESFKSLSEENKKFYQELTKVKGLIASANATISAQSELIKSLGYTTGTTVTKTEVCFKKGSVQVISDSTKALKFTHALTFGDKLKSDFKYEYKATIQTSFIRNKDKSISVQYKLDDPDATVTKGQAFIIPQEDRTKWQKFMDKNGRWIRPVAIGAAFVGGGYLGFKLAR